MSESKPEQPTKKTPAVGTEDPLDREWKRKQREAIRKYEKSRVEPNAADSPRIAAYKKQTEEAGRKVMKLLDDEPRFFDVFRERIRFAVAPYEACERQWAEEERQWTKQRTEDLAAAWRNARLRDKRQGPPTKDHEWEDFADYHSKPPTKDDIQRLRKEGSNVTLKEAQQAWKERRWGCWMRRQPFVPADISPAPWLQAILDGERFDESEFLPAYYGILAAIHDKHPGHPAMITKPVWPEYLLDHVWRLLDPLHGLPAWLATTIQEAVDAVERDLEATIVPETTTGGQGSGQSGTAAGHKQKDPEGLSDEARAVAAYVDDPTQSMTALGKKLKVRRQRLYSSRLNYPVLRGLNVEVFRQQCL